MQLAWELLPGATFTAVSAAIWISERTQKGGRGEAETAKAEGPESPGLNLFAEHGFEMHRLWQGTKQHLQVTMSQPASAFSFTCTESELWLSFVRSSVLTTELSSLRGSEDAASANKAKNTFLNDLG